MQAVIIAAGESSRFWPLNHNHKSQIKILGHSLVYWTVKGLVSKGISNVIIVVSPNSFNQEMLQEEVQGLGIDISFVVQEKPLGTGNAVLQAKDLIKEPFFIFWPYKIISADVVEDILKVVQADGAELVLVGAKTKTPWDYGMARIENNQVKEIVENPAPGKEPSNIKILGSYFLQPDFFTYYEKIKKHHEEDFIDALNFYLKDKKSDLIVLEKEPPSLKYPWEALSLMKLMLESNQFQPEISPDASIGENAAINKNVYIGKNVSIGANTVISGPAFIGDNCRIGANNVLRGPVNLEEGTVTGALFEIKDCLIQKGTHFHSGYVGDSVVGENCKFGAGFVTANRRIDRGNINSFVKDKKTDTGLTSLGTIIGNNSSFGIKSGTMPGVLIGSDCQIGPGTLVFKNIEDGKSIFTKFDTEKK